MGLTRQSTSRMAHKRKVGSNGRMAKRRKIGVRKTFKTFKGRRRNVKKASVYQARSLGVIPKQLPWYRHQPKVVRTTHINKISSTITVASGLFVSPVSKYRPGFLRDFEDVSRDQCFAEDYLEMCALYRTYRVNAVKMSIKFRNLTNDENTQFTCIMVESPSNQAPTTYNPTTYFDRNALMQNPHVKKRFIESTGIFVDKRSVPFWNTGWLSLANMEGMARGEMNILQYGAQVNAVGAHNKNPRTPFLGLQLVTPELAGWPANKTYELEITVKFLVEWSDLRQVTAPELDILDNDPPTTWPQPTQ